MMTGRCCRKFYVCSFLLWAVMAGEVVRGAGEKTAAIVGWPMLPFEEGRPPAWLGNDPVLGRLICPPVSRLNILKRKSEGLFFQDVKISGGKAGQPEVWTYSRRSGLYWWSGQPVTLGDLGDFVTKEIPVQALKKSGGQWKAPGFRTRIREDLLEVIWDKQPVFGPWVLDGMAFYRPARGRAHGFECAGIYRAKFERNRLRLTPSASYGLAREILYVAPDEKSLPEEKFSHVYKFRMAESLSVNPAVRPPDKAPSCRNLIELPYASIISWNLSREHIQNPALRQVLTSLTPRGALLRAGAGFQGELLSSLIPRNHPAYQSKVYVRDFDLKKASSVLNRLGYIRPRGDSMRLDSKKVPLSLNLVSVNQEPGILEKVIADSFMAVGIKTHYSQERGVQGLARADGVVTGVWLNWPEMNFMGEFHSRSHMEAPFWSPGDPELDKVLEEYALSLSKGDPDFQALGKIHKLLYILEPVTVLMQHKVCLEGSKSLSFRTDSRDPDWFRKIIL